MIKVENLFTEFSKNIIHNKISLEVKKGEIFGILGGSGSGKSTLLRQIILLEPIQSGKIHVRDFDIKKITLKQREKLVKEWAVLFQFGALFSSMNVLENIGIMLKEHTNLPQDLINDIAYTKLHMVGLEPRVAKLMPSELSGGMKKRVALARSLALDPKILFLDEPTSGLDPASAAAFDDLIVNLRDILGLTVVMVTHDVNSIKNVLDRFIILNKGDIILDGSYEDIINSNDINIKEFLND